MSEADVATRKLALVGHAMRAIDAIEKFNSIVNEFLILHKVPQTKLGTDAGGGVDFVRHMRAGRDLRKSTLLRVLNHIASSEMLA